MTEMVGVKKASGPLEPLPTSSMGFTATASVLCEIGAFLLFLGTGSVMMTLSGWQGWDFGGGRRISMETAAAEIDSRHVRRPTVSLLSRSAYLKEASPNPTQACISHTPPRSPSFLFPPKNLLLLFVQPTELFSPVPFFFFSFSLSASSLGPCALPFNGFSPQHLNLEGQHFPTNP